MATKKAICKWIREQSKKLPEATYDAAMKFYEPIKETGPDGKIRIVIGDWAKFPVNHGRRAKRAYKRGGIKELSRYFSRYGFKLIRG